MKTKEEIAAYRKSWREAHKEEMAVYQKAYREANKEELAEYRKNYLNTKHGWAYSILHNYNKADKKYNRGKGDLTVDWIVENVLSKPCAHCGESDWHKIGCNRIDNDLPHTKSNVEPCCWECNNRLAAMEKAEKLGKTVYQYTLDGELVRVWKSASEAARELGFNRSAISQCCRGICKQAYGYKWSFEPL